MSAYYNFLNLGDEWLTLYAGISTNTPVPTLFVMGHCIESYCKAVLYKNDPNFTFQQGKGHDIESMIYQIQTDIGILKSVCFYQDVEAKFMTGGPIPFDDALMADPKYLHYVANQELYWVAKFQKDLKYLGTSGKKCLCNLVLRLWQGIHFGYLLFKSYELF
jgi:hypothetical protein